MTLYPYPVTALSRTVVPDGATGRTVITGAVVQLFDQDNAPVTMYDNAAGANGSTTKQTDVNGQVVIFVEAGAYRLEINGRPQQIVVGDAALRNELANGNAPVKLQSGQIFGDSGAGSVTIASTGRVGIGENNPASLLAVKVENNATAGIRCRSEWIGSTASPYQNNDNCLFETYNKVTSDSLNLSWSVSAPNGYNDIPAGVIDTGERFGVYGWAVSVNIPGYTHAGTLATQYGVYGRAGFQGGGAFASPPGAVIQNSIGVRGQIRSDSPGAKIVNARAGEFLAWGYESGTVEQNYAVFSRAANGTQGNWSFYGDLGNFFNREKSFFGTVASAPFTESNARISSRMNNNSFEWGFPGTGYGCNIGATPLTGYPYIAFCAEAQQTGDLYRTRGRVGHVIQSSLLGELLFGILPSNNQPNQQLAEAFRITAAAGVVFSNRVQLAGAAPATSTSAGSAGQVAWDADYIYLCVATNTWKRVALNSW